MLVSSAFSPISHVAVFEGRGNGSVHEATLTMFAGIIE